MKNFIITAGGVLLILTVMKYQFLCNDMLRQKQHLKDAADEMAASAGLCYDGEAFGNGFLTFDRKAAEEKAGEMADLLLAGEKEEVTWTMDFQEDSAGRPCVVIFLRQNRLQVKSGYEYVSWGKEEQ